MSLADELGATAVDVLAEFGKAITLTRVTNGAYDPATSGNSQSSKSETLNALVEDYKPYELANGLAVVGDKKVTIAASGIAQPNLADYLTIDGARYSIVALSDIQSVLYILQARKT